MSTMPLPHSMTCVSSDSGPADEHMKCASPALLVRALPNWSTRRSLMLPCLPAMVRPQSKLDDVIRQLCVRMYMAV